MKNLAFIFIISSLWLPLNAQTQIKGEVIDKSTEKVIPFASFALLKETNQELVAAFYADENGQFDYDFSEDDLSNIVMQVDAIGYETTQISLANESNLQDLLLIKLENDGSTELSEIMVKTHRKAITVKGDKMIFDIEQMGLSGEQNALQMMDQLPGISLDKDENIQYRGSTGVQIMINGKKSMLDGEALREFIRSLPAGDIQSVEMIAQPSARYEASGTTGIINIVLKKNKSQQFGGNLYTYGGYGEYFKSQTGGQVFYNDEKWSVNAKGSYYNGKSFNDRLVEQDITMENGVQRHLNQNNYWLPKTENKNFNLGIERRLDKNQLISTEWQFYNSRGTDKTIGETRDYLNDELQEVVGLTQKADMPKDQISGNLFYNFTADSSTTKIDAQFNYSHYKKGISGFQENEFSDGSINRLNGENQTKYNMINAQLDWKQKLSEHFDVEAGGKFSNVEMDYFNKYEEVEGHDFIIPDSLLVNNFQYKEKLSSVYAQLNYKLDHWNFLAGLRMENYNYKATSKNTKESNSENYTHWFPSASASYSSDNNVYRLSYSRRISRPDYLSLNPYYQYLDAYSIERGNPDLRPQLYHSFELNYIYKNALSFSLYGYRYKDGFVDVVDYQPEENYNIIYDSNSFKGSRFGFSANIPYEINDWWTMQLNIDAFLIQEKSEIPNYAYNGRGYGYDLSSYHKFNLSRNWTYYINGFYSGRSETPKGYSPAIYDLNTSLSKSLFDDQLQITAGVSNLLKKSMWNNYSTVNKVTTHWVNKWETRRFYMQITYRFGKKGEKKVKSISLDKEENRIK